MIEKLKEKNILIYNKDALELLKELPDKSIDLIITDPPYGINYYNNRRKEKNKLKTDYGIKNDSNNIEFLKKIIKECYRVLKDGRHFYWFGRFDTLPEQIINIKKTGFILKNQLIWIKNNHGTGDLYYSYASKHEVIIYAIKRSSKKIKPLRLQEVDGIKRHPDILNFSKVPSKKMVHSHQKPLELLKFLIKKSSLENDIVLDPFLGSGTTAIASKQLNRKFIGTEIDKDYYNLIKESINKE